MVEIGAELPKLSQT